MIPMLLIRKFHGISQRCVRSQHISKRHRAGITNTERSEAESTRQLNSHVDPTNDQKESEFEESVIPVFQSSSLKPKLVHHVFRWGVGNAFRAHSKNRFKPTHAERNTEVSIRSDYFSCDREFEHCKVVYDRLNEQWEVLWTEFGKINGKPFPVKKFGIEESKAESITFAEQLNERLSSQKKDEKEDATEPGLTFDHTLHCWVALGRKGSRPVARAFSAEYHGYEKARELASEFKSV